MAKKKTTIAQFKAMLKITKKHKDVIPLKSLFETYYAWMNDHHEGETPLGKVLFSKEIQKKVKLLAIGKNVYAFRGIILTSDLEWYDE